MLLVRSDDRNPLCGMNLPFAKMRLSIHNGTSAFRKADVRSSIEHLASATPQTHQAAQVWSTNTPAHSGNNSLAGKHGYFSTVEAAGCKGTVNRAPATTLKTPPTPLLRRLLSWAALCAREPASWPGQPVHVWPPVWLLLWLPGVLTGRASLPASHCLPSCPP